MCSTAIGSDLVEAFKSSGLEWRSYHATQWNDDQAMQMSSRAWSLGNCLLLVGHQHASQVDVEGALQLYADALQVASDISRADFDDMLVAIAGSQTVHEQFPANLEGVYRSGERLSRVRTAVSLAIELEAQRKPGGRYPRAFESPRLKDIRYLQLRDGLGYQFLSDPGSNDEPVLFEKPGNSN